MTFLPSRGTGKFLSLRWLISFVTDQSSIFKVDADNTVAPQVLFSSLTS